jgi:hypothetical protein
MHLTDVNHALGIYMQDPHPSALITLNGWDLVIGCGP